MIHKRSLYLYAACTVFALAGLLYLPTIAAAQYQDQIGYTQLLAEYGASLETGAGVDVSMVEAPIGFDGNNQPIYLPVPESELNNPSDGQFQGKSFTKGSPGSSNLSTHSRGTGYYFFGNSLSISPGVSNVTVFEASDYINNVLNSASINDPLAQNFRVQNHSWVGNLTNASDVPIVMNRFDYINDVMDITSVVGVNTSGRIPDLMAHSYNSIAVGRSSGAHSTGFTTTYGAGRVKPEIVAPQATVSRATATVSSAAALMHEATMGTDASRSEVIKAMLLAGATKEEFAGWDRTQTRPLDEQFGAGELNIYNTYKIWEGGQFDGTDTMQNAPVVGAMGWDYNEETGANQSRFYAIDIAPGTSWTDVSIILSWNMQITDLDSSGIWNPVETLANMDLILRDDQGNLIDQSISSVDNVEHIYLENLGPGTYFLEVFSDTVRDYGLAWRATRAVPEPNGILLITGLSVIAMARRKRNKK